MDVLFAMKPGVAAPSSHRAGADAQAPSTAPAALSAAGPMLSKAALAPAAESERAKPADGKPLAPSATADASAASYDTKITYEAELHRTSADLVDRPGDLLSRFPPEQLVRLMEENQAGDGKASAGIAPEPAKDPAL